MSELIPELLRELTFPAASGLVLKHDTLFIVSDDELSLFVCKDHGRGEIKGHKLFEGELPEDPKKRKKQKPDFEALVCHGSSLFAIPSGSKANRHMAVEISLQGAEISGTRPFSLKNTYQHLLEIFPELNLEGAVIKDEKIFLFQRGNGKSVQNAVISLALDAFLQDRIENLSTQHFDLGLAGGTPLSFTDACLLENGNFLFLACAEASESTYEDGEVKGAILGELNPESGKWNSWDLNMQSKPEGIDIDPATGEIFICTDDDDRSRPSGLYRLQRN